MNGFPQAPTVLYDGTCNLCIKQVKFWRRISYGIDFLPLQENLERFPQITYQEAMREMKLINTEGIVYGGAEAFVKIVKYSYPILGYIALLYYLPGIHFIANKVYAFVAKNRYRFFGKHLDCEDGSCAVKFAEPKS